MLQGALSQQRLGHMRERQACMCHQAGRSGDEELTAQLEVVDGLVVGLDRADRRAPRAQRQRQHMAHHVAGLHQQHLVRHAARIGLSAPVRSRLTSSRQAFRVSMHVGAMVVSCWDAGRLHGLGLQMLTEGRAGAMCMGKLPSRPSALGVWQRAFLPASMRCVCSSRSVSLRPELVLPDQTQPTACHHRPAFIHQPCVGWRTAG